MIKSKILLSLIGVGSVSTPTIVSFSKQSTPFIDVTQDIEFKGEQKQIVVDTGIDKSSKWDGQNGIILTFNLTANDLTLDRLQKNYFAIEVDYSFKHVDNAPIGKGTIKEVESTIFREIPDVVNHNEWSYPSSINESNSSDIYDNNYNLKDPDLGLIQRYRHKYTQNSIWAFYAIDAMYDKIANSIKLRSTSIAGKFRSGWNQAKVHSKVITKIQKIRIKSVYSDLNA